MNKKDILYFSLCSLFWGATWIIIKDQVNHLDPHWSVFIRFGLSAFILFCIILIRDGKLTIETRSLKLVIPFALFQFCLNFNSVYVAETYVISGLVAIIFSLLFIPNAVLSYIFLVYDTRQVFILVHLYRSQVLLFYLWTDYLQI